MPQIEELPFKLRTFLKLYPWRRISSVKMAAVSKPLSHSRVALVTTAGFVTPDQKPFDERIKGGDFSYRIIPKNIDVQSLAEYHRSDSFDHAGIAADRNLAFPLDQLHELAHQGVIGEVAPRHISFMGSITAPGRLMHGTAPEAADILTDDKVDVALLVPV